MSKSLELTINRPFKDRNGQDWYVWQDTAVLPYIADMHVDRKRLTSAELLAQYWFNQAMGGNQIFGAALWRAATLPHFDEETS